MIEELKEIVDALDEGKKVMGGMSNAIEANATKLVMDMWSMRADKANERLEKAIAKARTVIEETLKVN